MASGVTKYRSCGLHFCLHRESASVFLYALGNTNYSLTSPLQNWTNLWLVCSCANSWRRGISQEKVQFNLPPSAKSTPSSVVTSQGKNSSWDFSSEIETVYGDKVMNCTSKYKWCSEFKSSCTSAHDNLRSRRPSIVADKLVENNLNKNSC